MWKITFKNSKNEDCVITIKNGASDTDTTGTDLVPAADPLTLQMDDDDDVFKPVRLSSGNINILCDDMTTLQSIIAQNPLDRPVTLTIGGIAAWKGFVKSEAFDQTLFGCNEQFSIPVMSCLSALKGIYVNQTNWPDRVTSGSTTTFNQKKTMSWVIDLMNTLLGSPFTITYPTELSSLYVNKLNWIEELDVTDVTTTHLYDGKTYMEVLEDLMKYNGMVVYGRGATLDFNKPYKYLNTDTATALTTLSPKTTDHTASVILGKKSVSVQANANVQTGTVLDFKDIVKRLSLTSQIKGSSIYESDERHDMFECRMQDTDSVFVNAASNIASTKTVVCDSDTYACAIEYEGVSIGYLYSANEHDFLSPSIILRNDSNSNNNNISYITFYIILPREIPDSPKLKFSFKIQTKGEKMSDWETPESINVFCRGRSDWYRQTCEEGKLEILYKTEGFTPITSFSISANSFQNEWTYARITNFKIEYDHTYVGMYGMDAYDQKETYEKKTEIGKGFEEDYSLDLNLVSARASKCNVPGSTTTLKLYGRGYVTNADGSEMANSEVLLCNALYNYYRKSRNRLCIKVDSSTYFDTNILYYNGDKKYHILAQELNVRDCTLKLTLQEAYQSLY